MLRILLIDDNQDDRALINYELRREFPNLQVEEVVEAESFSRALSAGNFDLVIIDYRLRWNDGLSVLRNIKSRYPSCPVVMFTDSGSQEIAVEAMKAGLDDYLTKSSRHYSRLPVVVQAALRRTQDIIWRKQAEQALKESEAKYRLILDTAAEGIWLIDASARTTYINQQMVDMLGYSLEEILGRSAFDFVFKEDLTEAERYYERTRQGIKQQLEFRYRRKDGSQLWTFVSTSSVLDDEGQFLGALGMFTDITDRKQAMEALKESEERQRLAMEAAQIGMWFWDIPNGNLIWTPLCKTIFGLNPDQEVSYQVFLNALHPDDRERTHQAVMRSLEEQSDYKIEYRTVWPDGSIHWISAQGRGFYNSAGTLQRMMGVVRDITERKQAEEQLRASLKEKEVLLKEMHHRVKNNLQIVSSLLNLQADYLKDEQAIEAFKDSQSRINSMALIHEKLYQSQDLSKINFPDYVHELVASLFYSYNLSPHEITQRIDIDNISFALDTAIPCGFIINEIVLNSLKHAFLPNQPGEIYLIGKYLEAENKFALIIGDNGIGLPLNFDWKNTESLGLQLVDTIINQINATVSVDSSRGVEFRITFPYKGD